MREQLIAKLNALAVAAYKVVGLLALAVILTGLLTYLGVQAFFLLNRSWVAPTVVSPTDRQILDLNAQIAVHTAGRERLIAERRSLEVELADAERVIAAHAQFEARFEAAVRSARDASGGQLAALQRLSEDFERTSPEIARSTRAFAGLSRVRSEQLKAAGLIDREGWLTTNQQLAQLAQSKLAFAERGSDLTARLEEAKRDLAGYEAVLERMRAPTEGGRDGVVTPQALLLEKELVQSGLAAARAEQNRRALRETIAALDASIAQHGELLATIRRTPWLRATERNVTVAFVPYENLENARVGEPLHGCALQLIWCRRVGVVKEVYEGEVSTRHPVRNVELRGVMVEIELDEGRWAREQVLHVGGAPLLL